MGNSVHLIVIQSTSFLIFSSTEVGAEIMIYDHNGQRKYLSAKERRTLVEVTTRLPSDTASFCLTLVYTGARISEALALTPERIDIDGGFIIIESLKKRRNGIYRAVPVPLEFLTQLDVVHRITASQPNSQFNTTRLWPWGRTTAWQHVKRVLLQSGVPKCRAMPRALRHSFGVAGAEAGVPLNVLQRWMGHASLGTTAIYVDVVGEEERAFAERMWITCE